MIDRSAYKGANKIGIYVQYVNIEFKRIKEYSTEIQGLLNQKQLDIKDLINDEIDKEPNPQYHSEIIEFFIDDVIKYEQTFPELLLNSTFTSAYSLFESLFSMICNLTRSKLDLKLSMKDLNGNGIIDKCKKYLEYVANIDLSSLDNEWNNIKSYSRIRNLIVHNSSNFKKNRGQPLEKQEMYNYILSHPLLQIKTINRGVFYIKESEYILKFCEEAEAFIQTVCEKISESS